MTLSPYAQVSRLSSENILSISNLDCDIGAKSIFKNLNLQVPAGSFCCLLGASGSGKTTLLRIIAGLQPCLQGDISLDAQALMAAGQSQLPPQQRGIGMVFQDYALFPHLSVRENLLFGMPRCDQLQQQQIVQRLLDLVDLQGFEERLPHQLSGGQQQRIAVVRALAPDPRFMLLDEPFSNLDQDQRLKIARQIKLILKNQQVSALMVTHDQKEALMVADYVGILADGQLLQWDTPYNLYHRPNSKQVAEFIGQGQWLPAVVKDHQTLLTPLGISYSQREIFCNALQCCRHAPHQQLYIRSEDIELIAVEKAIKQTGSKQIVRARISEQIFAGFATLCFIELIQTNGFDLKTIDIPLLCRDPDLAVGDEVGLQLKLNEPILFPSY